MNLSPLDQAHALSAQASDIVQSPNSTTQQLRVALKAYRDAADIFERSANELSIQDGSRRTLQLLTTQHRKLAKDVERRISTGTHTMPAGAGIRTVSSPGRTEASRDSSVTLPSRDGSGLGLGAIARQAWPPRGVATRASPVRALPPFAMRPPPADTSPGDIPGPSRATRPSEPILSPLHSSSSSSGTEIGDSYINFGLPPDTLDPFSRFWGMLDNMLEDISNPVAFASAPIEAVSESTQELLNTARRKDQKKGLERRRSKTKDNTDTASESFYVVNKGPSSSMQATETPRNSSPTGKTPEELALENENLRVSLDAIALHAQAVENENKSLRAEAEERVKAMKTVIGEVRREAQKAKHGQDVIRSQLLSSVPSPIARQSGRLEASKTPAKQSGSELEQAQKKRIEELELEVKALKTERDSQRECAVKYKERLDKIKINAKSKKEAKAKAEAEAKNES